MALQPGGDQNGGIISKQLKADPALDKKKTITPAKPKTSKVLKKSESKKPQPNLRNSALST
jgi:hypothetical protein